MPKASPFNGRIKQSQIVKQLGWDSYAGGLWHLYHTEMMSAPEIAKMINDSMPQWFDGITARSIQRSIKQTGLMTEGTPGTRSVGDAFRLAIKRDRVQWAWKAHKVNNTKQIAPRLRYTILKRDGFQCLLCGATAQSTRLEVDHIIPRAQGGEHAMTNMRTLCIECNTGRQYDMRAEGTN